MDLRPDDDADAIAQAVAAPLGDLSNGQRRAIQSSTDLSVEILRRFCNTTVMNLTAAFGHLPRVDTQSALRYTLDQLAVPLRRTGPRGERAFLEDSEL